VTQQPIQRGHIYRVVIDPETTMLGMIISANSHNRREEQFTMALVSTDRKVPPGMPAWVRLTAGDPSFGHVVCSHIGPVYLSNIKEDLGTASQETIVNVGLALKRCLGL
jgi:mRNA-degrading endonuclease toxin of MazEF toxin-antitoxin module